MPSRIVNRIRAYRVMLAFRSHLRNWRETWFAFRTHVRGGSLELRSGVVIRGGRNDDVAGIFKEIFIDRCYTPDWFYRAEPGHTVFDVGANIGLFTLYLSGIAPGIRVVAFEPHARTFERLVSNLEENHLAGSVSVERVALGREPGEVRFTGQTGLDSGHEAAIASGSGEAVTCVDVRGALELADGRPIDLLKIDTEGAEADILAFVPSSIWSRIARVVVEYHDLIKRDQVVKVLQGSGYQCRVVPSTGFEHHLGLIYAWRL
jgi:FkbM family methyltransferase